MTVSKCMLLKVSKADFKEVWCKIPEFRAEFLVRIFGKMCRLDHVLNHNLTKAAFMEFLRLEHATENMEFIDRIAEFKAKFDGQTQQEKMSAALEVAAVFLDSGAEKQVNIPQAMMTQVKSSLDALESKIDPVKRVPPRDTFDGCKDEIFSILEMGTFARFKKSTAFLNLLTVLRAYEQMNLSNIGDMSLESRGSHRSQHLAPPPTDDQRRQIALV